MWCNISGKAAGEIWNWSFLGVKQQVTHSVDGSLCCATRLMLYSDPTATYTSVPSVGVAAVKNGFTLHRALGGEISTRNCRPTLLRGVALSKSWVSRGKSCSSKVTAYWPLGPSPSYLNVQLDCGGTSRSQRRGVRKKKREEKTGNCLSITQTSFVLSTTYQTDTQHENGYLVSPGGRSGEEGRDPGNEVVKITHDGRFGWLIFFEVSRNIAYLVESNVVGPVTGSSAFVSFSCQAAADMVVVRVCYGDLNILGTTALESDYGEGRGDRRGVDLPRVCSSGEIQGCWQEPFAPARVQRRPTASWKTKNPGRTAQRLVESGRIVGQIPVIQCDMMTRYPLSVSTAPVTGWLCWTSIKRRPVARDGSNNGYLFGSCSKLDLKY